MKTTNTFIDLLISVFLTIIFVIVLNVLTVSFNILIGILSAIIIVSICFMGLLELFEDTKTQYTFVSCIDNVY